MRFSILCIKKYANTHVCILHFSVISLFCSLIRSRINVKEILRTFNKDTRQLNVHERKIRGKISKFSAIAYPRGSCRRLFGKYRVKQRERGIEIVFLMKLLEATHAMAFPARRFHFATAIARVMSFSNEKKRPTSDALVIVTINQS